MTRRRPAGTLKQATAELVDAVGGGYRAGDLAGVSQTQIVRYTIDSEEFADTTIPAGRLRLLELAAREPVVTRFLAAEQGYLLLRMPEDGDGGMLAERSARIAAQVGRLFEDIARALSPAGEGGASVTPREAGTLIHELDALFGLGSGLRSELVAIRDGGGRGDG
jgi:hypothetical protein